MSFIFFVLLFLVLVLYIRHFCPLYIKFMSYTMFISRFVVPSYFIKKKKKLSYMYSLYCITVLLFVLKKKIQRRRCYNI